MPGLRAHKGTSVLTYGAFDMGVTPSKTGCERPWLHLHKSLVIFADRLSPGSPPCLHAYVNLTRGDRAAGRRICNDLISRVRLAQRLLDRMHSHASRLHALLKRLKQETYDIA